MSSFVETQFPADISYGSKGGPGFSTDIVEMFSGREQRNVNWTQARCKYNAVHGVKTPEQLTELIAFFRARQGRAIGFRFKDWSDYQASNQQFGTGNGILTAFQLVKKYTNGSVTVSRTINKPVNNSVLKIYVNSVQQISGFTLDYTTGIVTFTSAPVMSAIIAADFEFDVPVRFDTDNLDATIDDFGSRSWGDIPLVEIRI